MSVTGRRNSYCGIRHAAALREEFNVKVCTTIGCPLVSSVGEVLASSTGEDAGFLGCAYDPIKEISTAKYRIKHE